MALKALHTVAAHEFTTSMMVLIGIVSSPTNIEAYYAFQIRSNH
jgi:hypothetical protein